jgi:diguanylate cyclase
MDLKEWHLTTRTLSRDIIRTCWWVLGIYIVFTCINLLTTSHDRYLFVKKVVLLPSLEMSIVLLVMGWYARQANRHMEFALLAGVNLFICIIIFSLYELPMTLYLLVLPVLISLYFYRQQVIWFALIQGLGSLALILYASPEIRQGFEYSQITMLISLLVGTAMIINNLRKRAQAIAQELIRTTQEKQDLQTKNILMEQINRIDAATGLYNHRSFHEHLDNLLALPGSSELNIHLALLDIDSFKLVNDTFGHAAGDIVIKYVAEQLKSQMEPDDFASRYGGEEFAILSVGKSIEHFHAQVERVRLAVMNREHDHLDGRKVSISIGVQHLQPDMSKSELFHGADMALYSAKRTGKNRTVISDALE